MATGTQEADHRVLWENVRFVGKDGKILDSEMYSTAVAVQLVKTIQDSQNDTIQFHKSGNHSICPVNAARRALRTRKSLMHSGRIKPADRTLSGGLIHR